MKKRPMAIVVSMIMVFSCLTACGDSAITADSSKIESSSVSDSTSESSSDSEKDSSPQTETTTTMSETTTTTTTSETTTTTIPETTTTTTKKTAASSSTVSVEGVEGKIVSWGDFKELFIPSEWAGLGRHGDDPHSCWLLERGCHCVYFTTLPEKEFRKAYCFYPVFPKDEILPLTYTTGDITWTGTTLGTSKILAGFILSATIDGKTVMAYSDTEPAVEDNVELIKILSSVKLN
ncbi:MAG: hypothetical protein IJM32_09335 [Ruminococcus sp.]|nr:hypothetical protein [Ruminococcus sp.]